MIEEIAQFFDDLLGCVEGTPEYTTCHAKSRKYATWLILIIIILLVLFIAPKIYYLVKRK